MITKVKMVNCQSWKNSDFTLVPDRLNTIVADNGTGKSVFMKMLKITACPKYFSREERKHLIRTGEESATIYFEFDDGGMACTKVFPTYTLYMYKPFDSVEIQKSYEPLPEVLKRIGLITDESSDFVANIIDTDQDLLLVNSKLKNNYNLIRMHTQNPMLETVRERVYDTLIKTLNTYSSIASKKQSLQSIVDEAVYFDIDTRAIQLDNTERSIDLMYQVIDVYGAVAKIVQLFGFVTDYELLSKMLTVLETIETIDLETVMCGDPPVNVLTELEIIDSIEALHVADLLVASTPTNLSRELNVLDSIDFLLSLIKNIVITPDIDADVHSSLQLLSLLDEINLMELFADEAPREMEDTFEFLCFLDEVVTEIEQYSAYCQTKRELYQDVLHAKDKIMSSGDTINCPIHGKVVYNGEDCIPYSD